MMKKALILFLSVLATAGYSQVPYTLLKDVAPNVVASNQYQVIVAGGGDGTVYFSAETPLYGLELWKTDGTEAGTAFVKDIMPGPDSSSPQEMRMINGFVYFKTIGNAGLWVSDGTSHGTFKLTTTGGIVATTNDLVFFTDQQSATWRTDGTQAGTWKVLDTGFSYFGTINDKSYFFRTNSSAYEVWSTDGTVGGASLFTSFSQPWLTGAGITKGNRIYFVGNSVNTGYGFYYLESNNPTPVALTGVQPGTLIGVLNNKIIYYVQDNGGGRLYATDGTAPGTVQLGNALIWDSLFQPMVILNNEYYYVGTNDAQGTELWKTDGTANGTKLIKDITPGSDSSSPYFPTLFKGKIYFSAMSTPSRRSLWSTDGTTAGTVILDAGVNASVDSSPFIPTAGKLFFTREGSLWATSGAVGSSANIGANGFPNNIVPLNEGVFYALEGNAYFSNGTSSPTRIYTLRQDPSINWMGSAPSWVESMMHEEVNGTLNLLEGSTGPTLVKTDGTPQGTTSSSLPITFSYQLVNLNGKLLFDNSIGELWTSDGTTSTLIKDLRSDGNTDATFVKKSNGRAFYSIHHFSPAYETRLWSTDGTTGGTFRIDFTHPDMSSTILGEVGSETLIATYDDEDGTQIWKNNGTAGGTSLVKSTGIKNEYSIYSSVSTGSVVYFPISNSGNLELWRSDGTNAGTYKIKTTWVGGGSWGIDIKLIDNIIYLMGSDGTNGVELWRSDGTDAGTYMVKDLEAGAASTYPSIIDAPTVNGYFMFTATNANDKILYKSDGTMANTTLVKNFVQLPDGISKMVELNGVYYFIGWDADHGSELWKSDGTTVGTVLVKDIFPGKTSSFIKSLTKIGSDVYFVANDDDHGYEIWKTDGTLCGTAMLTDDSEKGVFDSFIVYGQKLVFPAYDRKTGSEYHTYDLTLPAPSGCKTPQTITFPTIAEKHWGDAQFPLGASSSEGLTITYKSSNTSRLSISGTNAVIGGVGTVVITATQTGNSTIAEAAPVSITVQISKATLTATANEHSTSYGDLLPGLTIAYTGFVNGETKNSIDDLPTATTTATTQSDAGNYSIVVSGGSDDHYNFQYVNNTLHIDKATLMILAEDKSVAYNENIPTLTFTTMGLMGSDDVGDLDSPVTITTTATKGSNVGEYPITFEDMTDNNYDLIFNGATLNIEKAEQTIDFPAQEPVLVGTTFAITTTTSSGLPATLTSENDQISITGTTIEAMSPGLVTVTATQAGNENYLPSETSRQFCINPAKPVLTYDDTDHIITSSENLAHEWYADDELIDGETSSTLEVNKNGVFTALATVDGCQSETSEGLNIVILGLEDDKEVVDVIYPSPAKDFVYVKINSASVPSFTWMNSTGKQLSVNSKIESDNLIKFDLTDISAGVYLLKVNSSVNKIIKIN